MLGLLWSEHQMWEYLSLKPSCFGEFAFLLFVTKTRSKMNDRRQGRREFSIPKRSRAN